MKNLLLLTYLIGGFSTSSVFAQSKPQHKMLLTSYTYSASRNLIGKVKPATGDLPLKQLKVKGSAAKYFFIDENNDLYIRAKAIKPNIAGYDIIIEMESAGEKLSNNFRIIADNFKRNKVIAHRGAWKNTGATENSIASLKHAAEMGCEGSEFDVHMSADSVLYIHHDQTINGRSIEKSSSDELSKIKLENGEYLPTLENYLKEGLKQNSTFLILEIKPSSISKERGLKLAEKVLNMVRDMRAQAWINYISFDYEICKKIIASDPYAKVAYLNGDKTPAELAADKFYGLDYNLAALQKNQHWITEAHQEKLTVNAWTVNDEVQMDWLLNLNADFITTNEPELLLKKVVQ
ncbi:MAG: glycerophosphodiester phosphodiesterase [Sphingobacteriaceae bacterium]